MLLGITAFEWLVGIELLLLFVCFFFEKNWLSVVSIVAFYFGARFLGGVDILAWVRSHGVYTAELTGSYLVLGLAWGFVKWYFFLRNIRDEYIEYKKKLVVGEDDGYGKPFTEVTIKSRIKNKFGTIPPQASENKARISNWISYWPMSILSTLLTDFLTKVFNEIYRAFSGAFQKISNSMFKIEGANHGS